MPGDYTRFTFDPAKRFSGVRKQQGRVSLDSDFNEFEEILDRRDRAEMYDVVGQAVVPLTTRDGFEIGVNGAGELTIGAGRLYVDGILVECFGDMSVTERDDHLGGVRGRDPVGFGKQPSFYQPNFPGLLTAQGAIKLVYLDVWQREVTVFEDEALREPALNGPDTATRVQTVWQVKVMPDGANAESCAAPPDAWTKLTAASTARLSTQATAIAPKTGPCIINPAGGYTGIENRLYRVEIHKAGKLDGTAQFKWSRDNASLAAGVKLPVKKVSATESIVTVNSTGRDAWMRFEPGDHIELLDDDVELAMRETTKGGPMAKVLSVNHATGEIHVDRDLSGFTSVAARHPRIRRWNIAAAAAKDGVAILLEEGISITFGGGSSATLHAGDFWVFAARTADGSIETLVDAPPRGVLHHYARLALVASPPAGSTKPTIVSDCRHFWPAGCCCCTIEVGDGFTSHGEFNDIAQALDVAAHRVSPLTPIRICVLPGVHRPMDTVVIQRSKVTIVGCGPASRIVAPLQEPAFVIRGEVVRLESLFLATFDSEVGAEPIVQCTASNYTTIIGNRIEHYGRGPLVRAAGCRYLSIVDNFLRGIEGLQLQGEAVLVERNFLSRVVDDPIPPSNPPKPSNPHAQRGLIDLRIGTDRAWLLANRLERGEGHGLTLSGLLDEDAPRPGAMLRDIVIAGNDLRRMRGSGIATGHFSGTFASGSRRVPSGTTPVYIHGLRIEHNQIEHCVTEFARSRDDGAPQGGIVMGGVEHLVIADNHIVSNGVQRPPSVPLAGIYVGHAAGLIVRDNVVTGNSRPGAPEEPAIEGGIVGLDLVVPTAPAFTVDDDFTVDPSQEASVLRPINPSSPALPLGDWPAARVHGNLVVSQTRALTLLGLGPMQVTDNRLVSRDLFPILEQGAAGHTGTVLIGASGFSSGGGTFFVPMEPDLQVNDLRLATGGVPSLPSPGVGNVIFSDNDIVLDRAQPWQEPSQMGWPVSVAQISASDDLAFHDNVIRCTAGSQNLQANTYLSAFTTRATGNGVFEDGLAAFFLSLLLTVQGSGRYTVTDNQTTHCIQISGGWGGLNINNLEGPFCQAFTQTINLREALAEVQESRLATLARIADLTRSEEEALREQKTELARIGGADDLRLQELEARIRGAESLRESIGLDLRMSDRAKEIQPGDWTLIGRVLDSDGRPIAGARLELQEGGKPLIEAQADERGEIFAHFPESGYKDVFERAPQLKAILKTADGTVLQTLKQTLTPAANRVETFELRIDKALTPGKPAGSELQPPQVPDAGIGESKEEAVPEIQEPADVLKAAQAAPRKRSRKKASASEEEPTPKPGLETGQASAPRARKQRPRRSKTRPKPRQGE